MGFDLELHLDPHVEISREELELGLPPSRFSDALKEVQDIGYRICTPQVIGTGNSKFLTAGPNGSIRASSTSATDLQQAEVVTAANGLGSHPDKMSWPQLSMCNVSPNGSGGEGNLLTTISLNLSPDEVQQGETAIFRRPSNTVAASYSILPSERRTGSTEYEQAASKVSFPNITPDLKDTPIRKVMQDEKFQKKVLPISTKPGNGSKVVSFQEEVRGTSSVEHPKVISKPPLVYKDLSNGKACSEAEYSGPIEAAQRSQLESEDPNFGSRALPTSFSGLFHSILASENPSSQLVETARQRNGLSAAPSTVPTVNEQAVTDIANTTTRLMLDNINQPPLLPEPPDFLQAEKAPESRTRMKPNTAVATLGPQPISLLILNASRAPCREGRVASAATTVSAAASAAKNAVQAAEASIAALANLGINNGSLYQGRTSYVNPRPLKVACGSRPVAAGVKRAFQDQRPPIVEQTGVRNTTSTLDAIKVGSTVEVMPEEDGLQGGWFIAKVLSMTSKEALVVYEDMMTDDGGSHLEESFPYHFSREEGAFGTTVSDSQGWIRPVHPFSSSQKRHFMTHNENWVVGDPVDAFVEDGWWEAIIEDLSEADETKITVFFPGDGSTAVVKAWNVRPSLIWKKGEWRPCRGDSVEQAYPPSKRQKTSSILSTVEREHTETKAAATGNPAKKTPEPRALPQTRRSGASRNDDKGMVLYSNKKDSGQSLVTPARELRSATRSNANIAQTKRPVNWSVTPASKTQTPTSKATQNGSSPLTRSHHIKVSGTPELTWDVRRHSTRLQEKEVSQSPPGSVRGKTSSTRFSKKAMLEPPGDILGRKTPSRRSQQKDVVETPGNSKALAIVPLLMEAPATRSRTRLQRSGAKKDASNDQNKRQCFWTWLLQR